MNIEIAKSRYPLDVSSFQRYTNRSMFPPVDANKFSADVLYGPERERLRTPTTGRLSLVLWYKAKEGAVSSFYDAQEDLKLLQLQGARSSVSFRVARGFYWTDFMADEIVAIASHRQSGIRRIIMPSIEEIQGIEKAASEMVRNRYNEFATRAGLQWSRTDNAHVRDIRRR